MDGLTIRRLTLDLSVAGTAGAAPPVARIKAAMKRDLGKGIGHASLPRGSAELVHIRRLEIALSVLGDVAPGRIAEALGQKLAEALRECLDRPDAHTVVFTDAAQRRAAYVEARLAGGGGQAWWFAAFDGLAPLPAARAVTTALAVAPEDAAATLRALPAATARRLARRLGPDEARRLLEGWAGWPAEEHRLEELRKAAILLARQPFFALPHPETEALARLMHCLRSETDAPGLQTFAVAALDRLAHGAERSGPAQRSTDASRGLDAAPDTGTGPQGTEREEADAAAMPGSRFADPDDRIARHAHHRTHEPTPPCDTPFANLALLWPLADAALAEAGWAEPGPPLLALLATAAGPEDVTRVWSDPVWQAALLLSPDTPPAGLADPLQDAFPEAPDRDIDPWLKEAARALAPDEAEVLARAAQSLLARFAWRLPGFADSTPSYLRANLLDGAGRITTGPESVACEIAHPPLDILLVITGMGARDTRLADGRVLSIRRKGR